MHVVPKDVGREIYSIHTAKGDATESHKNSKMSEQVLSGSGRTTKASQLNFNINGTPPVKKHVGEDTSASGNQIIIDQNSNAYASLQNCFIIDRAGSNIMKEPIEVDLVYSIQEAGIEKLTSISGCIQPDIDLRGENTAENLDDEHMSVANAFQKQTQVEEQNPTGVLFGNLDDEDLGTEISHETQWQAKQNTTGVEQHNNLPPSKALFQQWTDDQLDILDMDD